MPHRPSARAELRQPYQHLGPSSQSLQGRRTRCKNAAPVAALLPATGSSQLLPGPCRRLARRSGRVCGVPHIRSSGRSRIRVLFYRPHRFRGRRLVHVVALRIQARLVLRRHDRWSALLRRGGDRAGLAGHFTRLSEHKTAAHNEPRQPNISSEFYSPCDLLNSSSAA